MISAATPTVVDPEDIVLQDVAALSRGDVDGVVALFSMDAKVHRLPEEPRRLVGELSTTLSGRETMRRFLRQAAAKGPQQHYEIIDYDKPFYMLTAYRVQDGLIQDLWHIGRSDQASVLRNAEAQTVIERLVRANNQGDVEAFSSQAKSSTRKAAAKYSARCLATVRRCRQRPSTPWSSATWWWHARMLPGQTVRSSTNCPSTASATAESWTTGLSPP